MIRDEDDDWVQSTPTVPNLPNFRAATVAQSTSKTDHDTPSSSSSSALPAGDDSVGYVWKVYDYIEEFASNLLGNVAKKSYLASMECLSDADDDTDDECSSFSLSSKSGHARLRRIDSFGSSSSLPHLHSSSHRSSSSSLAMTMTPPLSKKSYLSSAPPSKESIARGTSSSASSQTSAQCRQSPSPASSCRTTSASDSSLPLTAPLASCLTTASGTTTSSLGQYGAHHKSSSEIEWPTASAPASGPAAATANASTTTAFNANAKSAPCAPSSSSPVSSRASPVPPGAASPALPSTVSQSGLVPHGAHYGNELPKCWGPDLSHIDRVIMEIVETERTYVHDLKEIIEGYLKHMRHSCIPCSTACDSSLPPSTGGTSRPAAFGSVSSSAAPSSAPVATGHRGPPSSSSAAPAKTANTNTTTTSCTTNEQIVNLFGNLEDVYSFNSSFLSQLEECGLDPLAIARCFVLRSDGFDVYTQYCTDYPRTVSLLTDLMRNKETAEMFKVRQLALKHSLPLGSYLLKPVQRILKYHLLLQNIVKHSDTESDAYADIKNALSVMTNIACHINDMKRKHEHAVRVQEIQSLLYGWEGQDLTTFGELVAEGSFRMFGAKGVRHLLLFDKMLLVAKKKKKEGMFSYKSHIMCSNLMLIESISGEPLCFNTLPFDNPRVQNTFQARNVEQKREWCLQLKRVILENYNAVIPSHAKQLVLGLGQSSAQSSEKHHSVGKRTLSAPEYLERRTKQHAERSHKSETLNLSLHKGFKLRKSLKKMQLLDSSVGLGARRARSSSHDEAMKSTVVAKSEDGGRRASCGIISATRESSMASLKKGLQVLGREIAHDSLAGRAEHAQTSTPAQHGKSRVIEEEQQQSAEESPIHRQLYQQRLGPHSVNGYDLTDILNVRPPPRTLRLGTTEPFPANEAESDYVTFYLANTNRLLRNRQRGSSNGDDSGVSSCASSMGTASARTSTCLSSGSSELSMASSSQSEDSSTVTKYRSASLGLSGPMVRRVQSFTGSARSSKAEKSLQHTLSFRHSPTCDFDTPKMPRCLQRPTTLDLNRCSANSSSATLPSSSSLEEMSPTAPAMWLKRQEKHFPSFDETAEATGLRPSGSASLPRGVPGPGAM